MLRRCQHVAKVLDGAGAHQDVPVRFPGRTGKGGRQGNHFRALLAHGPKQLGEAKVVAHRQSQPAEGRFGHDRLASRRGRGRLAKGLLAPGQGHVEKVHLVVSRRQGSGAVEQAAGRSRAPRIFGEHGNSPGHDPHPQPLGLLGRKLLPGPVPRALGMLGAHTFGVLGHQGEVLRQDGQRRSLVGGPAKQRRRAPQVFAGLVARTHLYDRHLAHGASSPCCGTAASSAVLSNASQSTTGISVICSSR